MRWQRKLVLRLKSLFQRNRLETDLSEELRFHLEQETGENMQRGMESEEARYAALRLLGAVAVHQEECRDPRGLGFIENLGRDLRYAGRILRRTPAFAFTAILTLALGIGANTTVFTLLNTILFRPLPVKEPQQLVFFNVGDSVNLSYPDFKDFRERNDVLSGMTAYRLMPMSLSIHTGNNLRVWGYEATSNYFDLLGVQPLFGRFFHAADGDTPGAHPVVVLSYAFWRSCFNGDPNIAGQTVKINGFRYSIIGVAPSGFRGTELIVNPDVWVPMSMETQIEPGNNWLIRRESSNIWVLGRLKARVSRLQAAASLNRIAAQLARAYPSIDAGMKIQLSPPGLVGNALRGPVIEFASVLMGVAGLLLLLACVNLAGMLLARGADRRKEIAVRLAIGARRGQVMRQLLIESLTLAAAGSAAGFLLSVWLFHLLSLWRPAFDMPANTSLVPDMRVLLFTFAIALLTTILFGLLPALEAARTDVVPSLKNDPLTRRFARWNLRDALIAGQIALSVLLLISSVLVVRSLQGALSLNLGFNPNNAVSVSFDLGLQGYTEQRGRNFQKLALERISALPGVQAAGEINSMPLRLGINGEGAWIGNKPEPSQSEMVSTVIYNISPGYLRAAGTRLLAGRDIDSHDRDTSPPVALVNETLARKLFPHKNPVGKRFHLGSSAAIEIVGLFEAGKYQSLGEDPQAAVFVPVSQRYDSSTTLVARSSIPPDQALRAIRSVVTKMDPELTLFNVGSLKDELALPLFPARVAAIVLGAYGLLAILLASTGVFGLLSYAVSRRSREIGIRMALGARAGEVLQLILRRTVTLCFIGALTGTALAFGSARLFSAVLYGISPRDPITYVVALLLMTAIAVVACWYPARRAIRIDPAQTLREQ